MSIEHTFLGKDGLETRVLTKAKAIRLHCLNCSGFYQGEVTKCSIHTCVLYPFRFGNEKGLERIYTEEDKENDQEDEELFDDELEEEVDESEDEEEEVVEEKPKIKPKKILKVRKIRKIKKV